jgi:hypothetical protein
VIGVSWALWYKKINDSINKWARKKGANAEMFTKLRKWIDGTA